MSFPSNPFELEVYDTLQRVHGLAEPVARALAISASQELDRIRVYNEILLDPPQTGIYDTLIKRGLQPAQAKLLAIQASQRARSTKAKRIMEDSAN